MDLQAVTNLFSTSLNPDPNVRLAGELEIRRVGSQEGVMPIFMQIISNEGVDIATRQACAVYFKNRVQRAYFIDPSKPRPDAAPIAQSDRVYIKQNILPLLVASASRPIRTQLASCFKTLVSHDFPEKWPTLLDEIYALLVTNEPKAVYGGLIAFLEVMRACRFRRTDDLVNQMIIKMFPTLVQLGTKFGANPNPESAEYLYIILKTYKTSTQISLSPHQQSPESIIPWGTLFFQVVKMQLPQGVTLPGGPAEWETSPWWKAKKWAYNTLNRLFDRFGNPSQLPAAMKKDVKAFSEHFVTTFAPEIFKTYLEQVQLFVSKQCWLSKKCQKAILQFFTSCVKPKSTWQILKPQVDTLVAQFVFPIVAFDEDRAELWNFDQVEYLRRTIDDYEEDASPVSSATAFLGALASSRGNSTFMPLLNFINSVLSSGTATPNEKYGALNMIVSLSGIIMRNSAIKPMMENFLVNNVLPELASPQGFMRGVACEVIGSMERFELAWTKESNLEAHYTAVVNAMSDPDLAVRVPAAIALTHMIRHEAVQQALKPNLEKVIQELFKLSDETDLEVVSETLETFIEVFNEQLAPVSAQLASRLCATYARLLQQAQALVKEDPENDLAPDTTDLITPEDDKTLALMSVVKTIQTLVDALDAVTNEGSREILLQVQEQVVPIIKLTLETQTIDLFDSIFGLVDSFTFTLRHISPSMWTVFELMYKCFKGTAIDYLDDMTPSLDNFVDFGKEVFAQNPEYRRMALDFCITALSSEQLGEMDRVNGCSLGESILLNLRGQIDDALPTIIGTVATLFAQPPKTRALRIAVLNTLVNAVLYNPALTLQIMNSHPNGLLRAFFDKWFTALRTPAELPRAHDKQLSIMALCALLEVNPAAVPDSLRDGWAGLLGGALRLFKDLPKALENRAALAAEYSPEVDSDEEDDIPIMEMTDQDDQDVRDEDNDYLDMLAEEGLRLRTKGNGLKIVGDEGVVTEFQEAGDDDDDDDSDNESIEEDLGVETSVDAVDPYITFKRALTALQMNNPPAYQAMTTSLDAELQTVLMEVMAVAESKDVSATA